MVRCNYVGNQEEFYLENPEMYSYLYFPLANEQGVMSSITPDLAGDNKLGQNMFLMPPVSSENLHNDRSSRNIWCKVNGNHLWSLTGRSPSQLGRRFTDGKEKTEIQAGFMNQRVSRTSKELGLMAELTSFVPSSGETVELLRVELTNISGKEQSLQMVAAVPIYGRSADNIRDHRHVTALLHRIYTMESGVAVHPTMTFDERGHRRNEVTYGVFGGNETEAPVGFFPVVEDFIGEGGNLENPGALYRSPLEPVGKGTEIDGYEALGGLCFEERQVKPGETITYIIVMGYSTSPKELENLARPFFSREVFERSLEETKKYWRKNVNVSCETADGEFDRWMRWVGFQPMLRRIYGCSFLPHHDYGKGGRGWRDLWQDCLALLIMNPAGVRGMLLDNFGGVRMDGTNATIIGRKQGEFIADRNNITRVWMDHGVWPFLTTQLYIHQTGDLNLLLEETSYFKDLQACRGQEKDHLWSPDQGQQAKTAAGELFRGSILEHLLVSHLTAFYDVGEHNHIRIRGADWNDALDMAGNRGESVAFTAVYGANLSQLATLILALEERGTSQIPVAKELMTLLEPGQDVYERVEEKKKCLAAYCNLCRHHISGERVSLPATWMAEKLKAMGAWIRYNIRNREWVSSSDGHGWYNGYYDDHGQPVEGETDKGVRMMLTSQVFTVMSGTADDHQVTDIIKAADTYLYRPQVGGYRLNTDFHEVKMDLGRMFGFAYGHKENGAVFSHMATMYGYALYQRGRAEEGLRVLDSLYSHCSNFETSRIFPGVPEYIDAAGRGMYHYLTGAASWMLLTVVTQMFGIRGRYGDLEFVPGLTSRQFDRENQASLSFVFAGKKLNVVYCNPERLSQGEYRVENLFLDGEPYSSPGKEPVILRGDLDRLEDEPVHRVKIILGKGEKG